MGIVYHIQHLLSESFLDEKFVVIDTNVLTQLCDDTNVNHSATLSQFEKFSNHTRIQLIYFVSSRFELQEYLRKRFLTLFLRKAFSENPNYIGGTGVGDHLCRHHEKICAGARQDAILTGEEINMIRIKCFNSFKSMEAGIKRWNEVCQRALKAGFTKADKILTGLGIQCKGHFESKIFPPGDPIPKRKDHEQCIQNFALCMSDSIIISMAKASRRIHGVITNDQDMIELLRIYKGLEHIHCYTFVDHFIYESVA